TVLAICLVASVPRIALAHSHSDGMAGAWTASVSAERPELLNVSLEAPRHDHSGARFRIGDFVGLAGAQVGSPSQVPVRFELRRAAGPFAFEGSSRQGKGAGQFMFEPNPDFPEALRRLGVEPEAKGPDQDEDLFTLAMFDVSTEFIQSMQAIGYK